MCQECEGFIKKRATILDLGCGSGIVGDEFKNFFDAELIGVDVKDMRVKKIPFRLIDGFNLPFDQNFFDIVLIIYVLHHARDPLKLLKEAKRVTKEKIIIYEDLKEGNFSNPFLRFHCLSFNTFFQKEKKAEFNFKNDKEWKETFENLNLRLIFEKKISNFPVKKKLFVLSKI